MTYSCQYTWTYKERHKSFRFINMPLTESMEFTYQRIKEKVVDEIGFM